MLQLICLLSGEDLPSAKSGPEEGYRACMQDIV